MSDISDNAEVRVTRVIIANKILACPNCGKAGKEEYEEGEDTCKGCGTKRPAPILLEDPKTGIAGTLYRRFFGKKGEPINVTS